MQHQTQTQRAGACSHRSPPPGTQPRQNPEVAWKDAVFVSLRAARATPAHGFQRGGVPEFRLEGIIPHAVGSPNSDQAPASATLLTHGSAKDLANVPVLSPHLLLDCATRPPHTGSTAQVHLRLGVWRSRLGAAAQLKSVLCLVVRGL